MLKSELIAKLNEIEGDFPVRIFDHRKNLHEGEGSVGLYEPDPSLVDQWSDMDEDERAFHIEEHETELKPFIALYFDNEEFDVWANCENPDCKAIYECANSISVGDESTCPKCNHVNHNSTA